MEQVSGLRGNTNLLDPVGEDSLMIHNFEGRIMSLPLSANNQATVRGDGALA